ncbi:MAG: thioredoxin family protein [Robiginitalea sp.]|nr:thioredoxin family protein [Robiginitalea sp.]
MASTQTKTETASLVRQALEDSWDYPGYRELVRKQVDEGRTSGLNQSEAYVYYTLLNHKRMRRWEKKTALPENLKTALSGLEQPWIWLVLTETWCGDAAPVLPIMDAFASQTDSLELRIALRDEHQDLMDLFLTNNARSIPKLLMVRPSDYKVVASWGPRPEEAAQMVAAYREEHGKLTEELRTSLQKWYNADRGESIIRELSELLALE